MRVLRWVLLCGLFFGITAGALAQDRERPPLIAKVDSTLYRLHEGALLRFDACMPQDGSEVIYRPFASPDGWRFAFLAYPPMVVDAIERSGGIGGGPLPADLWLCDIASGTLTQLAPQPADASFFNLDVPDKAVTRSFPAWSADGSTLAWTELNYPEPTPGENRSLGWDLENIEDEPRLMLYDAASGETDVRYLGVLPVSMGIPAPYEFLWLGDEMVFFVFGMDDQTFQMTMEYLLYRPQQSTFTDRGLLDQGGEQDAYIFEWLPVTLDDGTLAIGLNYGGGLGWRAIVPYEQTYFDGLALEMLPAREGAIRVERVNAADSFSPDWRVSEPNALRIFSGLAPEQIALAPDGSAVAVVQDGQLTIYGGSTPSQVLLPGVSLQGASVALAWGQPTWRFSGAQALVAEAQQPLLPVCVSGLPSRLQAGGRGRVMADTGANNVRQSPGLGGFRLGQIPSGGVFDVLEGPTCADGYAWYRVRYGDLFGWTAEGGDGRYWLEPSN